MSGGLKLARAKSYEGVDINNCCALKCSMGLPCRHLFSSRIQGGVTPVFSKSDILPQWCIGYGKTREYSPMTAQLHPTKKRRLTTRRTALTKDNKFRDFLLLVCKDMADLASNEGMVSFRPSAASWTPFTHCFSCGKKESKF